MRWGIRFTDPNHRLLEALLDTEEQILCVLKKLLPATSQIKIAFGGNMAGVAGAVVVGSTVVSSIVPLEADGLTVTPGAVVSAQGYAVDNAALASFVVNPDGSATWTGLSAGTANVTATATVTDSSGTVNTFTATSQLVVSAVTPPAGTTASIEISWSPTDPGAVTGASPSVRKK